MIATDFFTRAETVEMLRFAREHNFTGALEVLVRGMDYQKHGMHWCPVDRVVHGDAAPYPIRVHFHDGTRGQYQIDDLLAARPGAGIDALLEHRNCPHWLRLEPVIR